MVHLNLTFCYQSSLNVFVFDEKFNSLQGLGSQIDLRVWYSDNQASLCHAAFLCGSSEELILIDTVGHMRVYSLTTQTFRYACFGLETCSGIDVFTTDPPRWNYLQSRSVFIRPLMVHVSSLPKP